MANRNGLDAPGDGGRAAAVDEGRPLEARFLLEKTEGFFWGVVLLIWPGISIFTNSYFGKKHIFYSFGAPVFPWFLVFFLGWDLVGNGGSVSCSCWCGLIV